MKVLVTGGTGFLGSQTVAALVRAGHDPRLLVRSPERVAPRFEALGVSVSDVLAGDVLDRESVVAALDGCDGLIHAANVFTFDPAEVDFMREVNETGTEIVLGSAIEAKLDPIVHVSSYVTFLPAHGGVTEESPVGEPTPIYSKTKALGERIARRYQEAGAPVTTVYPGLIWGSGDPYMGESMTLAKSALQGRLRFAPAGVVPISDVRDVAAVHAQLMEPGKGVRRFIVVGHDLRLSEVVVKLGEVAGRRLRSSEVPDTFALGLGRAMDGLSRLLRRPLPVNHESMWLTVNGVPSASTRA